MRLKLLNSKYSKDKSKRASIYRGTEENDYLVQFYVNQIYQVGKDYSTTMLNYACEVATHFVTAKETL